MIRMSEPHGCDHSSEQSESDVFNVRELPNAMIISELHINPCSILLKQFPVRHHITQDPLSDLHVRVTQPLFSLETVA